MKTLHSIALILMSFSLLFSACAQKSDAAGHAGSVSKMEAHTYACPMHPEVMDSKPSKCIKCGMTLVKKS
jgi:hypothetical protein